MASHTTPLVKAMLPGEMPLPILNPITPLTSIFHNGMGLRMGNSISFASYIFKYHFSEKFFA